MSESILQEQSNAAKGRSLLYRILASLYLREASQDTLLILSSKEVVEVLNGLGVDTSKFSSPADDAGQRQFLDDLAEEYTALFILPGGVSPYESVRLKGLLCQDPEWQVRDFYKKFGVVMCDGSIMFSDHIGMELDFMSYLAGKEAAAWALKDEKDAINWMETQRDFFREHINKWVKGFIDELDKCAFHPFYKEVSVFTRALIEVESEDLLIDRPVGSEPVEVSLV